jgi:LmbE family N-acetylglucosaminyl deacetylase
VPNPWLDIPADDYVGHMSDAVVAQHPALNRILRETLEDVRPASVLVLGCSTGNGFEHIDPGATSRVALTAVPSARPPTRAVRLRRCPGSATFQ